MLLDMYQSQEWLDLVSLAQNCEKSYNNRKVMGKTIKFKQVDHPIEVTSLAQLLSLVPTYDHRTNEENELILQEELA